MFLECTYLFDYDGTQVRIYMYIYNIVHTYVRMYICVLYMRTKSTYVYLTLLYLCPPLDILHIYIYTYSQMYCSVCSAGEEVFMCDAQNCAK